MSTKIAKDFKWEMSHRLPFHEGPCRNIHGHTYKVRIEITGELNEQSMVLDYYDVERIVRPLIQRLDHSFLCDENDKTMLGFLKEEGFKYNVMKKHTTAENILELFFGELEPKFQLYKNVEKLKIRIYETDDVYAERELELK